MDKLLLSLFIILSLTACGSDSDSNSNIDLDGTWKRGNMPFYNLRVDHTWTFSNDGTFIIDNIIYHEDPEEVTASAFEGTFSLGTSIDMPSGQTAIELNLIYDTPDTNGLSSVNEALIEPGSDAPPVSELAYLQDDNLYFGTREVITTEECSDLYLLGDIPQYEYPYEYDDSSIYLVDRTNCYIRPTELDFDNVLFKVE